MISNRPQNLDEDNWYYENTGSISLIHQVKTHDGQYLKTDIIKIPWGKLRKSLWRLNQKGKTVKNNNVK